MIISYLKSIIIWGIMIVCSAVAFGNNVIQHYGKYFPTTPEKTKTDKIRIVVQFLAVAAIPLMRMLYVIVIIMLGLFDETRMRSMFGDEIVDDYITRLKEKSQVED